MRMLKTQRGFCVLPLQSRTISPPRCPANKNSVDLSRIDPAHYSGGSFLMLAFKNAQCNFSCVLFLYLFFIFFLFTDFLNFIFVY